MVYFFLFVIQIILIYFLSQRTTNEFFFLFFRILKNKKIALYLVSLLYLPGTIIHEVAHFFTAAALFLKVRDLNIFPEIYEDHVKLGSVRYERADPIRGFIVGVAPFFVGIVVLYIISALPIDPYRPLQLAILLYSVFTITSTMFSSKQDLVDSIYLIPVVILVGVILYILQINPADFLANSAVSRYSVAFLSKINYYVFVSLLINFSLILFLKLINRHRL